MVKKRRKILFLFAFGAKIAFYLLDHDISSIWLKMEDILGNDFSISYAGILENWESVEVRLERVKVVMK